MADTGDPQTFVVPRDASTIMLVRDVNLSGEDTLEVCMVRRHLNSDFVGGAYVFPGGKVDLEDRGSVAEEACTGRSDAEASDILQVPSGGLAFWVAALRECFEEAGVLLAYQNRGVGVGRDEKGASGERRELAGAVDRAELVDATDPEVRRELAALRDRLNGGDVDFLDGCKAMGLSLAVDKVHYFSHWITPEPAPKRYDTRFFVAALPPGQVPVHDDHETVDTVWVRPAEALERALAGEFDLIFPTMKNLQAIVRFSTSVELLSAAVAVERVPTIVPRVVSDERGFRILLPGDPGYEEAMSHAGTGSGTTDGEGAEGSHRTGAPATDSPQPNASQLGEIIRSIGIDGRSNRGG